MSVRTIFDVVIGAGLTSFATILALEFANVGVEAPYLGFILSSIAAVVVAGPVGGTTAIFLSIVATWFFFIPPVWSFRPPNIPYLITIILFVAAVICSCRLYWRQRHMIDELSDANATLRQRLFLLGARSGL